jgi:hypothetical protein
MTEEEKQLVLDVIEIKRKMKMPHEMTWPTGGPIGNEYLGVSTWVKLQERGWLNPHEVKWLYSALKEKYYD